MLYCLVDSMKEQCTADITYVGRQSVVSLKFRPHHHKIRSGKEKTKKIYLAYREEQSPKAEAIYLGSGTDTDWRCQCSGSGSGSTGSTCFWTSRIRIH
jgi:hypothetical protein